MKHSSSRASSRSNLATAVAAIGLAGLLAGCAGGGGGSAQSTEYTPPDSDLEAEITYGIWDETQVPAMEALIAGFNEEYPNIEVNVDVTPYDAYFTKLQTQGSSGSLPDLFWMNGPNFQLYASNGLFVPITSSIEGGHIDPADYPEALVDLYTYDGVNYGVPKDFDTIGVWYNKALFAEAGVEEPQPGWTWDDFQQKAEAISAALGDQGIYGTAAAIEGQSGYYNTILQAGGEILTEDGETGYGTAEAAAGIQFYADLIASGASPDVQQLTDTYGLTWFTSGKAAMYQSGSWQRNAMVDSDVAADVAVVPMPVGERQATIIHGLSNVVSASSDNIQAAQALQAYLATEEAQLLAGEEGAGIPAFNGAQQAFVDSIPEYDLQVFLDAVDYSFPYPVTEDTAAWASLETELLPDAFSGTRPVEEVNEELATEVSEILASE